MGTALTDPAPDADAAASKMQVFASDQTVESSEKANDLKPFGVLEFAKSGRVAISKPMKTLEDYLNELG
jgi:acetolactate synthase-1/3 small subunit